MSDRLSTPAPTSFAETPVQKGALVVGIVFLLVGLAGFVPGLTTGDLGGAGNDSMGMLLGIFQVSVLHNIVHLLFGVVGVLAARRASGSRFYLVIGGVVYFVLWIYGLFTANSDSAANFVPLNSADNWLHLVLAIGMVALGVVLSRGRRAPVGAERTAR
ncbi:DUF4383 domain-containing protein [Curtobacterium sp. MCJR17_055]|uniref:DUF4383 domain-containing protein n=1 Tax=unclassified Curtobacterium TaxID=257496 RepID=UPI000D9210C1|nr:MULTISPECIES: DUF4383 domain-containing protein [unclassified Curtobacterium]PYY35159.1 DUF4383 domain-containing protein [Curtobacterium sp. MCBD17_029]PYY42307.1 DUF4383 domain-containing protein [Curtobacterium sp. MCPF17_046]PYY44264.1 DUF4383 domain-containing protein [Curtobacterium sp. MCBD17_023]PYY55560.1 DUF4383 domain-containing protein [Curtobacterium sp. MCJR17_055]PYY60306.1 DUF4383 domain-containing protein [Curtobacterium sp. MCPF17_015]